MVNILDERDKEELLGQINPILTDEYAPTFGEEIMSNNSWTGEGWSGSLSEGFTHISGNTENLAITLGVNTALKYWKVVFNTDVDITTDNIKVSIGNSEPFELYGQSLPITVGIYALENAPLTFIPSKNFTGRIYDISVKEITKPSKAFKTILDEEDATIFEFRARGNNIFVGRNVGKMQISNGGQNVGVGDNALTKNTSGFWNIGVGTRVLENNTVGSRNIGLGHLALNENETGHRNISIGSYSLCHNKTGYYNISIGADSLDHNTTGHGNVGVGFATLYTSTTAYENVGVGTRALNRITTGFGNVGIGTNALYTMTWHQLNTGVGNQALYSCTGSYNVGLGALAGNTLKTGNRNIFIGYNVQPSSENVSNELNIGNLLKGSMANADKYVEINGGLMLGAIPTTDPVIAGRVWNDNGTLKVSVG